MNIAIRADASLLIGTGHVMRCLSLAEELRSRGSKVCFVCREHTGHLCELIEEKKFEVIRLKPRLDNGFHQADSLALAHASWLGESQATDSYQTIEGLQHNTPWDWIIVDHYALDIGWESAMRKIAAKIMVIDDLADRKHDCDLLLDQNYFQVPEKRYQGLVPDKCQTLLGPRYALLRPEFRQARKFCRMRGNGIARVLVYFGGNDPDNLTGTTLNVLGRQELRHLLVDVVIGLANPHFENLKMQVEARPGTRLHTQPASFVELLLRSDLCIGAGGTTTWERLCLGLPSLVISTADNQIDVSKELSRLNLIYYIGHACNIDEDDIMHGVSALLDFCSNNALSFCDKLQVDGYGATDVAAKILEK